MVKELSIKDQDLNRFITDEKGKVHAYLRKYYSISDDVFDDIFQEASMALFLNIQDGKLSNLTSTLSTYFLRICINQTLKLKGKQKKVILSLSRSSSGSPVLSSTWRRSVQ